MSNIDIGGRLHSTATGNVVAGANEIFDDSKNKKQSDINTETYSLVNDVNERLNGLSPDQQSALSVAAKATNNETKLGYYVCDTEGNIAAKVISNAIGYVLSPGGSIKVKMTNTNTVNNATLNINSTGAKALYYAGERVSAKNSWEAGETVEVYYDGTSFYANSVAGGSSDGVFDVSVKYPTSGIEGGNTYTLDGALTVLNANLSTSKKKGGMSIKFIHDNKYVQYRLMATTWSTNTNDWSFYGDNVLVENSEWIYVLLDAKDRILAGLKSDGSVEWAVGIPTPVKKYIDEAIVEIKNGTEETNLDGLNKIIAFLSEFSTSDTLKDLLDTKVDKEENKSLIDSEYAGSVNFVENSEFIEVHLDAEDNILWAIKTDGSIYYGAGVPQQIIDYIKEKLAELSLDEYEDIVAFLNDYLGGDITLKSIIDNLSNTKVDKENGKSLIQTYVAENVEFVENSEWMQLVTDNEDKIIEGINKNGQKIFGEIPPQIQEKFNEVTNKDYYLKNVLWLGTSIPALSGYPEEASKELGFNLVNNAIGSSQLALRSGILGNYHDCRDLCETTAEKHARYDDHIDGTYVTEDNIEKFSFDKLVVPYIDGTKGRADMVVIDHGFNDRDLIYQQVIQGIGNIDFTSEDRSTFTGAFRFLLKKIYVVNPKIQVVIAGYFSNNHVLSGEPYNTRYICTMQKWLSEYYNIPIIPVWEILGISDDILVGSNPPVSSFSIFAPDTVHPHTDTTGRSKKLYTKAIVKGLKDIAYIGSSEVDSDISVNIDKLNKTVGLNTTLNTTLLDIVEYFGRDSRFDYNKVHVLDYYAAFDGLVNTYPNDFVKLADIGTSTTPTDSVVGGITQNNYTLDPNTYPIKHYRLKKSGSNPTKTIVLAAGIHGVEHLGIICTLHFLEDILRNHDKNQYYNYIYNNFVIEVIPVINPWGIQNHKRFNGRSVDLNRNFDYNWDGTSDYSGMTGGASAFSENESAAFRDFITNLNNVVLCIETHDRGYQSPGVTRASQFHYMVPNTDSVLKAKLLNIVNNIFTPRYYGQWIHGEDENPTCTDWVDNVLGIPAFEPELSDKWGDDTHSQGAKLVAYQMTDYLATLCEYLVYNV